MSIPEPITRTEQYYAYMANKSTYLPEPITREEQYLYYLCVNGSGGGNITPEQIQAAVDAYLDENPVTVGELSVDNHIIKMATGG